MYICEMLPEVSKGIKRFWNEKKTIDGKDDMGKICSRRSTKSKYYQELFLDLLLVDCWK